MGETVADNQQIKARLDAELLETIKIAAATSRRTQNAEINHALRCHYGLEPTGDGTVVDDGTQRHTVVMVSDAAYALLQKASPLGPYTIALSSIVERGIELAAQELEQMGKQR